MIATDRVDAEIPLSVVRRLPKSEFAIGSDATPRSDRTVTMRPLLYADDVAGLLGMTKDWVYNEVRARRFPHVRLGRYVRFREESVIAWLEEQEHRNESRVR